MTRTQAYDILNPIQNKLAANRIPLDIITFSAFCSEGEELAKYVSQQIAQHGGN